LDPLPKVAVVILNWNGRKYLEQFLPFLLASTYRNMEVIIADNGSTDDSISFLEKNYPSLRLIRFTENYGFAKGYNMALKQVESQYYVLLNSDVEVPVNWLEPMVELLESNKKIAACQPKLLLQKDRKFFEYAGGAGGWIDSLGYPFAKGRIFNVCEEDKGQYEEVEPIFWASGAAMFIRAAVYHEMEGFDDFFFAHQEEIDLCWRMQLSGYLIYSCPTSVVYHVGGGTLPQGNSLKTFLNFRNNRVMLSKNLPISKRIWVMPIRLGLDFISAIKGLFGGDPGYFKAVVRAEWAFIKWWMFNRSGSKLPLHKQGVLHGYLPRNIAWQHFIRKKRYFSEIVGKSK
jgi:GT2 family glycosyltransferase